MHRRPRLTRLHRAGPRGAFLTAPALAVALAGCGSAVDVEPAPAAALPQCAAVLARLRSDGYAVVGERTRRETDAQSTAAWGDPPVVLRCGVDPPGPTTDPCLTVEGVDWVAREAGAAVVFTTFGRVPALEVSVPAGGPTGADAVLAALAPLAAGLPQQRACL